MKTILQASKSRFKRSGGSFSVKTCSNLQPKIAVINLKRQRFRALNDVLSAKVIELSEMIYFSNVPKRDLLSGNFRHYQDGNHVFSTQTIKMSEKTCSHYICVPNASICVPNALHLRSERVPFAFRTPSKMRSKAFQSIPAKNVSKTYMLHLKDRFI